MSKLSFDSIITKSIDDIEVYLQALPISEHHSFLVELAAFTSANIDAVNGVAGGDVLDGLQEPFDDLDQSRVSMLTEDMSTSRYSSISDPDEFALCAKRLLLVASITMLYAEKKVALRCETLSGIIESLHDILISLEESSEVFVNLKKSISKVCELWWVNEEQGCENVVTQLLPYTITITFSPYANESDVKRLVNIEKALLLLDFEDESIDSLRELLLRCFINPLFLKCVEGRKFLAFIMIMHTCHLLDYIVNIIKPQIALGNRHLCVTYGDILLRAWRESVKDESKISDKIMIENCLQDLIYNAINAADRRYFKGLRIVLSCFNEVKRQKEVDSMIARIYTPLIWRSLTCANGIARAQCAVLFFDVFPLQYFDTNNLGDNNSLLERQFDTMVGLLKDGDHR
jgi:hypothetical protein